MSQGGPSRTSGSAGGSPIEFITGNVGGPVPPDAGFNFNLVANTTMGITTVGNAGTNTINILGIQATDTQIGVTALASNAEAIAGTSIIDAVTPASLAAKLGAQTTFGLPIGAGTSSAISWTSAPTDGQVLIGSTGLTPVLNTLTAGAGIGIASGPGTITITNTGGSGFTYTNVNASPYIVLPADQYLGVDCSAGAITIQLPNAPSTGRVFVIKDRTGSAATFNITVTTVGGAVLIDGATSRLMILNYSALNLLFDGTTYQVY